MRRVPFISKCRVSSFHSAWFPSKPACWTNGQSSSWPTQADWNDFVPLGWVPHHSQQHCGVSHNCALVFTKLLADPWNNLANRFQGGLKSRHRQYPGSQTWKLNTNANTQTASYESWQVMTKLILALSEEHWLLQVFPAVVHLLRRQQTKALLGRPRYPTQKFFVCLPFSSRSTFRI